MSKLDYKNVPTQLLDGAAESLAYGNTKYGEGKKRSNSSINDRYNSLMGHLQAWSRDEHLDPESGLSHLKHAAMQLAFLMQGNEEVEDMFSGWREGDIVEDENGFKYRPYIRDERD